MNADQVKQVVQNQLVPGMMDVTDYYETLDSWYINTDIYTLKIRKPIQTDTMDLTQLNNRKSLCYHELELNAELAEKVYEEVVPIRSGGKFSLSQNDEGPIIDYALRMKRLKQYKNLLLSLKNHEDINIGDMEKLAFKIAEFHKKSKVIDTKINVDDFQHSYEESKRTGIFVKDLVGNWQYFILMESIKFTRSFLKNNRAIFEERAKNGGVRNGHGNIKAENVYLGLFPVIIERSIDYSQRQVDVLFDISKLGADLDFYHKQELDEHILRHYMSSWPGSNFEQALKLYVFYKLFYTDQIITDIVDNTTLFSIKESDIIKLNRLFEMMLTYLNDLSTNL
jgi:uncharacterized protein